MQEPLHLHLRGQLCQSSSCPLLRQPPHSHYQPHAQQLHLPAEGYIADRQQLLPWLGRQLRWGEVFSAGSQEEQRTQIVDKAAPEENLRLTTEGPEKAPESGSAHL